MEVDPIFGEVRNVDVDEMGMEQSSSNTYSSLNNTTAWRFVLSHLQQNNILPSVLILSNVNIHVAALEYSCKAFSKGLLSRVDVMDVKCRLREFANNKPIELINNTLVKLVLASKTLILQTEIRVHTIVLCAPLKPYKLDLSLLTPSEFLQLRSIAGRRGLDNPGNIIFMPAPWINHKQPSSLVFRNSICITSVFKPSYSLLLSLLANHGYSMSKIMLQCTFAEYALYNSQCQRMQKVESTQSTYGWTIDSCSQDHSGSQIHKNKPNAYREELFQDCVKEAVHEEIDTRNKKGLKTHSLKQSIIGSVKQKEGACESKGETVLINLWKGLKPSVDALA
eukprot:Gb_32043 [translate_table: standard]